MLPLGPLTFTTPPNYIAAKIAIIAVLGFAIILIVVLTLMYRRENTHRSEGEDLSQGMSDSSFLDLTDRQNKEFRVSAIHEVEMDSGAWSLTSKSIVCSLISTRKAVTRFISSYCLKRRSLWPTLVALIGSRTVVRRDKK